MLFSLETNVRGTREILLIAQEILNLDVFLYVSTAFCTPVFDVKEKCNLSFNHFHFTNNKCMYLFTVYKSHMDPDFMIKLVDQLKPEELDNFQALGKKHRFMRH